MLDYSGNYAWAFLSGFNNQNQWIQVSSGGYPVSWTSIITQGRGDCCLQWVSQYKVSYSLDGYSWNNL